MICPECGSSDIRASKSNSWRDALPRALGRSAFRCRGCRRRFHASPSSALASKQVDQSSRSKQSTRLMSSKTRKRLKRALELIVTFSLAFGLFWIFLRYFTAEKAP
jgi:transposase-like protein